MLTNLEKLKNDWEQDINDVMNQEPIEDHDFSKSEDKKEEDKDSVSSEGEKQTVS